MQFSQWDGDSVDHLADDPRWTHNLRANPNIDVEAGPELFAVWIDGLAGEAADRIIQ